MNRLRTRLILAFLAATMLPLAATVWITTSLLDRSLGYATTGELDRLSRTLEATVRQFYQRERDALKQDALAGRVTPTSYAVADAATLARRRSARSGTAARPSASACRDPTAITSTTCGERRRRRRAARRAGLQPRPPRHSHGAALEPAAADAAARGVDRGPRPPARVHAHAAPPARRGVAHLAGAARLHRASDQPADPAAHRRADGLCGRRLVATRSRPAGDPGTPPRDEVGHAVDAFNRMADQLRQSRERLVHLTQIASWQSLARKTAHEVKNSLTPIRLTVEEMQARLQPADRTFLDQAVQIVVSEIDALERRVRAFSDFSSEPPVQSGGPGRQCARQRARLAAAARASRDDIRSQAGCARAARARGRGPGERHPHESAEECRRGGRARRLGARDHAGERRPRHDRGARLRPGPERRGRRHAVRADDHVQGTRHGTRPLDREAPRAALRRRHRPRRRPARRRGVQGDAAGVRPDRTIRRPRCDPRPPRRRRRRRAEHRPIAAPDSRGRRLPRHGVRVGGAVSGRAAAGAAPISICSTSVCRTATASTCCARCGRATTRRRW